MRTFLLAAVLASLWLAASAADAEERAPRMNIAEDKWDFGTLVQGQTAQKSFLVTNTGTADLEIKFVRVSCAACLDAKLSHRVIPPGGTGEIIVTFYSKEVQGTQEKVVYVESNDPEGPHRTIRVTGTVDVRARADLQITPDEIDLGLVASGTRYTRTIVVRNGGGVPMTIQAIEGSEACTGTAATGNPIPPGGQMKIDVSIDTTKLKGLIQEFLTIRCNDPLQPAHTVRVVGYCAKEGAAAGGMQGPGVEIRPDGPPVKLPGTEEVFYRAYRVVNHCSSMVTLRYRKGGEGQSDTETVELRAGEERRVPVDAGRAGEGGAITFELSLPRTMPGRAEKPEGQ
jgi:hypothetical protein